MTISVPIFPELLFFSDTVRRKTNGDPRVLSLLINMAEASRESIDSMSDIVWAVNPKKDQLRDLENRMRHVAGEMLSGRNVVFDFSSAQDQERYVLNPDLKRNTFLIFKECMHNIVRHSDSSKINIKLILENGLLLLQIQDDGKGFDATSTLEGQGLRNMKKRARELNGNLEIATRAAEGSLIRLEAPLNQSRHLRKNSQ
jgi:two-component system, NarL family, sensor histidine kinase UhpB